MFWNDLYGYISGQIPLHGNSLYNLSEVASNYLFKAIKQPNLSEIMELTPNVIINKMMSFYIIRYNYNGNYIWCPILALEIKTINNKNILYALNIEYLPLKYRVMFFGKLLKESSKMREVFDKNNDMPSVSTELKFPLEGKFLYNALKKNGNMTYCLTAYDVSKIKNLFLISTKIFPKILLVNTRKVNSVDMRKIWLSMTDAKMKEKLEVVINDYEKLIEQYQEVGMIDII